MRIEFDEEKHIYTVNGKVVPSVTDICNPITSEHYGAINAAILEMASRRGTAVHEATQLIDLGVMPDDDPEVDAYVNAYLDFLLDYKPKWEYIEYIGYNADMGYCGTIDRAGQVGNEFWVLDLKTTASPTKENYIATCCQTEAYALMIGKDCICKRKILYLKKDGSYRLVDCEEKEAELGLDSFYLFSELAKIKNYIRTVKERKSAKRPKKGDPASA
jgi:hypothetical protein